MLVVDATQTAVTTASGDNHCGDNSDADSISDSDLMLAMDIVEEQLAAAPKRPRPSCAPGLTTEHASLSQLEDLTTHQASLPPLEDELRSLIDKHYVSAP